MVMIVIVTAIEMIPMMIRNDDNNNCIIDGSDKLVERLRY